MSKLILTFGFIFIVLFGGILVDRLYARFARRNPQLGPFRKEGKQDCCSCASSSDCDSTSCKP